MEHPQTFLLKKIMGSETNGLKSLNQLHAKHIDDLSEVLKEYAEATVMEVIQILNRGESFTMDGKTYYSKFKMKK